MGTGLKEEEKHDCPNTGREERQRRRKNKTKPTKSEHCPNQEALLATRLYAVAWDVAGICGPQQYV